MGKDQRGDSVVRNWEFVCPQSTAALETADIDQKINSQ